MRAPLSPRFPPCARLIRATQAANVSDTEPSDESYVAPSGTGHEAEAKPCRFVLTVALRVRLRPRGAEYVFAEQFQWAGTPGSTATPLYVTTTPTELRHRTLDDFDSGTSLATSDRARGRAKPCRFVLTVALRVRLRPRGAEYVFAEQFQWAGTPGSTAAPLYVTTTPTELRHRTLDDFDSGTSLATSSSPLNRMSIF
ncbi:hypothetical protein HPB50_006404 [Hyalomma asiaticum]|uniref:Uncharacterized protein n=1 Tax=Hyalomma asiaticum TaxID=266040 RepID=A0ACB7SEY5_HYAAI|nr:hypothetical protein HPB50_006404 [Hyalomma asiaticum]